MLALTLEVLSSDLFSLSPSARSLYFEVRKMVGGRTDGSLPLSPQVIHLRLAKKYGTEVMGELFRFLETHSQFDPLSPEPQKKKELLP